MKLKEEIKKQYDTIANSWSEKVWVKSDDFKKQIIEFSDFSKDDNLLDVGIGAGDFSSLFDVKSVTGIDISKQMIQRCRKLHPGFELMVGDAEKLPFKDSEFSAVCCRNFLQNFDNPTPAFSEMVRVLKPGGKILIVESAVYEKERIYPTEFCHIVEPFHPLFPSHELLSSLFESCDLKNIKQEVVGLRRKWLGGWQKSKGATTEQRKKGYEVCKKYPDWYKEKYKMKFYLAEMEIESTLTFSFLKAKK